MFSCHFWPMAKTINEDFHFISSKGSKTVNFLKPKTVSFLEWKKKIKRFPFVGLAWFAYKCSFRILKNSLSFVTISRSLSFRFFSFFSPRHFLYVLPLAFFIHFRVWDFSISFVDSFWVFLYDKRSHQEVSGTCLLYSMWMFLLLNNKLNSLSLFNVLFCRCHCCCFVCQERH